MSRNYIGLSNTFHDSAIAIVDANGQIVFAEATERYLQFKRALNVAPDLFMRTSALIKEYCDPAAELVAAYSWSDAASPVFYEEASRLQKTVANVAEQVQAAPQPMLRALAMQSFMSVSQWKSTMHPGLGLNYELSEIASRPYREPQQRFFDHHRTHAATACYTSPYTDAVCAVIDGFGEGKSFACFTYRDGELTEIVTPIGPNLASLGVFFTDICTACGFGYFSGEEWKVMGLAPYGEPDEALCDTLRKLVTADGITLQSAGKYAVTQARYELSKRARKAGEPVISAATLAASGQAVFTEVLLAFLNNLQRQTGAKNLVLAGGCALNSSANGKILAGTKFESVHVFSAPADDGNAVGAALLAYREDHPRFRPTPSHQSPYLGSRMSAEGMANAKRFGVQQKITDCDGRAPQIAARLLEQGKIIGWIQGRAEFGPRALGNRSILADPRSPQMKEAINARVKFREEFRPFAPSILHEYGPMYFEGYQEAPYMERTLPFRQEMRSVVPAVVHHDGTGRLQTVKREWNERYHALIEEFRRLTGVPIVLNTSFNVMGKPISHSVEDVLAVFYTSGLDAVFIEDMLIEK